MLNKNLMTFVLCAIMTLAVGNLAVVVRQGTGIDADVLLATVALYINYWLVRQHKMQTAAICVKK